MSVWWGTAFAIGAAVAAFLASQLHREWLWRIARLAAFTACLLLIVANAQLHAWPMVANFGLLGAVVIALAVRNWRKGSS